MAGLYTCRNLPLGRKDELAKVPIEGNGILAIFYALTLALARASAYTPIPVLALGPQARYIDKDLQRATKLALELFLKGQKHG